MCCNWDDWMLSFIERECIVFVLIVEGKLNQVIVVLLFFLEVSVEKYIMFIFQKLGFEQDELGNWCVFVVFVYIENNGGLMLLIGQIGVV